MAEIYYTTGTSLATLEDPTRSNGTLYNGSYVPDIPDGYYIKAIAYYGFRASAVSSFEYSATHLAPPEFYIDGTSITILKPAQNATIYFTMVAGDNDGIIPSDPDDPTIESTLYNGSFPIVGGEIYTVIKAFAIIFPIKSKYL